MTIIENTERLIATVVTWACIDGVTTSPCAHCVALAASKEVAALKDVAHRIWEDGHVSARDMQALRAMIGNPPEPEEAP